MRERNMEKYFIHRCDNVEIKFIYIYIYIYMFAVPDCLT